MRDLPPPFIYIGFKQRFNFIKNPFSNFGNCDSMSKSPFSQIICKSVQKCLQDSSFSCDIF